VKNSRVAKAFKDVDTRQEPRAAAQLGEYLDALERERLLKDERFLEGVVVVLERQFWSNRPDLAEDAVAEACLKVVRGRGTFANAEDLRSYVYTVAHNAMKRMTFRETRRRQVPIDDEQMAGFSSKSGSIEDDVIDAISVQARFDELRQLVASWGSARMRAAGSVLLDAAFSYEPMPARQLAAEVGEIIDEEISQTTAWRLRNRVLGEFDRYLLGNAEEALPSEQEDHHVD
jgi:DNA-directed RNA polymerase specialized sigma24 family protein